MALYDPLALLLHLLREALLICSPHGRLRPPENVRTELPRLFHMIEALDCAAITHALTPLQQHIEDIFVPFKHAQTIEAELRAVVPHDVLECLVLAWHHDHCSFPAPAQSQHYHQREREFWLACAAGRLGDEFATLKKLVFDKLDTIVRASSLVEMVNGLLRPSLNSCKGQITQEAVNLIMFSHNHHRYTSGKRPGKAPIELLTGTPLEAQWWELLLQQVNTKPHVAEPSVLPPWSLLALMVNNDRPAAHGAIAPCQARVELPGTSEQEPCKTVPHAA